MFTQANKQIKLTKVKLIIKLNSVINAVISTMTLQHGKTYYFTSLYNKCTYELQGS